MQDSLSDAAKEARRRTRQQMQKVAEHIATNPEAKEFSEFWGTPTAELPEWKGPLPPAWTTETKKR